MVKILQANSKGPTKSMNENKDSTYLYFKLIESFMIAYWFSKALTATAGMYFGKEVQHSKSSM